MVKPLLRIVGSSTEGAENRNRFGCYYGELEDSKETLMLHPLKAHFLKELYLEIQ